METKAPARHAKLGVILTFLSLIGMVWIFEWSSAHVWTPFIIIAEFILAIIFIVGFIIGAVKTGSWKFTHKTTKNLTEQEAVIANSALRLGYSIFSIFVLLLLLIFALTNKTVSIVLAVALILLAHLIPVSIIAWKTKQK